MRPEFAIGAHNAVHTCFGVTGADRVVVIQDRARAEIAEAIIDTVVATGAACAAWTMEDLGPRPLLEFPDGLREELIAFRPTVSYFIGGSEPGELAFRKPLMRLLVNELGCRHGHMVGIDETLMVDGLAVDYDEVYRVTHTVFDIVREARRISVTTALGTDLEATFSPDMRWIPCDGRYLTQGLFGNLPEGECFTAPERVDGLLVGESMGDHFDARYGIFTEPARFVLEGGWVREATMPGHPDIEHDIRAYLAQHPNSSRVGEFAIGTNVGLTRIIGNFLQDEKFPGVHIAFGDPYGVETGADWEAPSHVDVLASRATVVVDGQTIMRDGTFLV